MNKIYEDPQCLMTNGEKKFFEVFSSWLEDNGYHGLICLRNNDGHAVFECDSNPKDLALLLGGSLMEMEKCNSEHAAILEHIFLQISLYFVKRHNLWNKLQKLIKEIQNEE